MDVNYAAVVVAALSTFALGGLWYSPLLFHRAWASTTGLTDEDLKGGEARIFGIAFLLALVMAANLATFLGGPDTTVARGATAGALAGAGWVAPAIGTLALFERRSIVWIGINGGYFIVAFVIMGAILGAWQ